MSTDCAGMDMPELRPQSRTHLGECTACCELYKLTGIDLTRFKHSEVEPPCRTPAEVCADEGHDWTITTVHEIGRPGEWPIAVRCERRCGHRGYKLVDAV